MPAYSIKAVQQIPVSLEKAWAFFADPANLAGITPANMGFKVISKHHGNQIYAGQIIEYKVRPLLNIPWYWMTEITHVKDMQYFVDEQRKGPYSLWHHQHHFKAIEKGVEMTDIVHYRLPFGFIGKMVHFIFVKKKLEEIFLFRKEAVEKTLGKF